VRRHAMAVIVGTRLADRDVHGDDDAEFADTEGS
jgi:hypothetical protein